MPRQGYGNAEGETILCPLFKAWAENEIRCESHVPESSIVAIRYRSTEAFEKQKRLYCEENWKRCEHYQAWLHLRWGEED